MLVLELQRANPKLEGIPHYTSLAKEPRAIGFYLMRMNHQYSMPNHLPLVAEPNCTKWMVWASTQTGLGLVRVHLDSHLQIDGLIYMLPLQTRVGTPVRL